MDAEQPDKEPEPVTLNVENSIHSHKASTVDLWTTAVKLEDQTAELSSALRSLTERVESEMGELSHQIKNAFENVYQNLSGVQKTSKELTAQVVLPSPENMRVQLVNTASLERLEEYRDDEGIWFTFAGICIGAVLGIVVNWVTGAEVTAASWILVGVLVVFAVVFVVAEVRIKQRIKKLKRKMFT